MTALLERRLLYVTGKGGVGRSTVAAALGFAAAAQGRRTVVCEVLDQSRMPDGPPTAGHGGPKAERPLAENLWTTSIDAQRALEEWLATQFGSRRLVRPLASSNAFQYFVAAAPGAKELVTITKAWELAQPERWDRQAESFDLVIVDAPASGHGLGMLRTPTTFGDIARVGPIGTQSERVRTFLADPSATGYVAVALPEEMPVTETLALEAALERDLAAKLDLVVVNRVRSRPFPAGEWRELEAAARELKGGAAAAFRAARSAHDAAKAHERQIARLRRGTDAPVVTLPEISSGAVDLEAIASLGRALAQRLARRAA